MECYGKIITNQRKDIKDELVCDGNLLGNCLSSMEDIYRYSCNSYVEAINYLYGVK